jgi:hypothetical protein
MKHYSLEDTEIGTGREMQAGNSKAKTDVTDCEGNRGISCEVTKIAK